MKRLCCASLLLIATCCPALALSVDIAHPTAGTHAGAQLTGMVYVVRPDGSYNQMPTHLVVDIGGLTVIDTTSFTFAPHVDYPNATVSGHMFMWYAHSKESPADYSMTATLTYFVMGGPPPGGGHQEVTTANRTFHLDNETPVEMELLWPSPNNEVWGPVQVHMEVVPAPKAGDGFVDDFIDSVWYSAFSPPESLAQILDTSLWHP